MTSSDMVFIPTFNEIRQVINRRQTDECDYTASLSSLTE